MECGQNPFFTPLEREIVSLIARGQSASEIARAVTMSPRTVARHIDACKHKLGARNCAQLVAAAVKSGELQR